MMLGLNAFDPNIMILAYTTTWLFADIEIIYEKEISLVIQIMTSKDKIVSYDTDYFEHPEEYEKYDYEGVFAVTIRFSRNPVQ